MLGDQHRVDRRTPQDAVEDQAAGTDHVGPAGVHVGQRLALLDEHREQPGDQALHRVGPQHAVVDQVGLS